MSVHPAGIAGGQGAAATAPQTMIAGALCCSVAAWATIKFATIAREGPPESRAPDARPRNEHGACSCMTPVLTQVTQRLCTVHYGTRHADPVAHAVMRTEQWLSCGCVNGGLGSLTHAIVRACAVRRACVQYGRWLSRRACRGRWRRSCPLEVSQPFGADLLILTRVCAPASRYTSNRYQSSGGRVSFVADAG